MQVLSLTTVSVLLLAACREPEATAPPDTDDAFRIGVQGPLSGGQQEVGLGMLRGVELAVEELNARGGILRRQVTVVPLDDEADPDRGRQLAEEEAADLDAVVGPYNSGVGLEVLPLYVEAGLVPMRLTTADETAGYGFTLQPMTSQIAPVATEAVADWLEATSVAIIFDDTQAYTVTTAREMAEQLAAAGVTVVAQEPIAPGAEDYRDAVDAALTSEPDVVYVVAYYTEAGLVAQAMQAAATPSLCFADWGAYDNGFLGVAGTAAQDCPVLGWPAPDAFPGSEEFLERFRARFDAEPGSMLPYTYDATLLLASAIENAGTTDAEAVTEALLAVDGWQGWTGTMTFEEGTGNRLPPPVTVNRADSGGTFRVDESWAAATGFRF